jgi:hypothetical protein
VPFFFFVEPFVLPGCGPEAQTGAAVWWHPHYVRYNYFHKLQLNPITHRGKYMEEMDVYHMYGVEIITPNSALTVYYSSYLSSDCCIGMPFTGMIPNKGEDYCTDYRLFATGRLYLEIL